jgi:hypothetical protein
MTWYFNNDGCADGPHDESVMRDMIKAGRIHAGTLIWHAELELWQEAGILKAIWWQQNASTSASTPKAEESSPGQHRSPMPLAPTEKPVGSKGVGLLKRWFGKKDNS